MMYDMVTKVVMPATTSRPTVVPAGSREKKFFTESTAKNTRSCRPRQPSAPVLPLSCTDGGGLYLCRRCPRFASVLWTLTWVEKHFRLPPLALVYRLLLPSSKYNPSQVSA